MNTQVTERNMQIALNHMKRCLTPFKREMEIKTIQKYFSLLRLGDNSATYSHGKSIKKMSPSYSAGKNINCYIHCLRQFSNIWNNTKCLDPFAKQTHVLELIL